MLAWRMRILLLVWLVQNVGFRGERNKSPVAFNRAAFEAFTSAVRESQDVWPEGAEVDFA